jgi:hypothetical protein
MSGRVIKLGRGVEIKGGKVKVKQVYRDASHAIRAKKSTKTKVVRRSP